MVDCEMVDDEMEEMGENKDDVFHNLSFTILPSIISHLNFTSP